MSRDDTKSTEDVALIVGSDEERNVLHILRKRGHRIEPGLVRPAEPGKPLMGDLVRLKPRPGLPVLCDVETLWEFHRPPPSDEERRDEGGPGRRGPAWVTSDAYRRGWERIFGQPHSEPDPDGN